MPVTYTLVLAADAARDAVSWQPTPSAPDLTAEYILGAADATLPNSLVLTAGSGITLTPGGGLMTVASSGGGGPTNSFPHVDLCAAIGGTADGPGFTPTIAGTMFAPNVAGSVITGIRFYWVQPTVAVDVVCSLWNASLKLATGTVVAAATGIHTAVFTSPYTVLASDTVTTLVISTFAPTGSGGGYYCNVNGAFQTICNSQSNNTVPVAPVLANPHWRYQGGDNTPENVFGISTQNATETAPTTKYGQSSYFAMEPVFA